MSSSKMLLRSRKSRLEDKQLQQEPDSIGGGTHGLFHRKPILKRYSQQSRHTVLKPQFMRDNFSSSFRRSAAARCRRPASAPTSSSNGRKPRWIPAPGLSHKGAVASSRETFPLCLVCDRPWDFILGGKEEEERFLEECCSEEDELQPRNRRQNKARRRNKEEEDAGEDLVAKFQANSKLLKQLDEAVRAKSGQSRLKLMQELWEMDGGHKLERDGKWSNLLGADGGERTYSDSRCQSGRLSSAKKSSRSSFRQQPMMSSGFEVDRVEVHHPTDHRRSSSRKIKVEKSRKSRKKDQKRKSKSKGENEKKLAAEEFTSDGGEEESRDADNTEAVDFIVDEDEDDDPSSRRSLPKSSEDMDKNLTESMSSKLVVKNGIGRKSKKREQQQQQQQVAIGQETVEHHRLSHSRLKKQSTIRDGNEIQDKDALETDSDSRSSTESATLTGSSKSSKKPKATRDKKVEKSSASSSISRRATNIDFGGNEDDHKDENDFFVEVIIDELKKENRELKFTLMSREEQLQKAADKVQEMVEEKSRLAKKLEKALSRAHEHAENYDEEMQSRESKFKRKIDDLNRKIEQLENREMLRENEQLDDATVVVNALKKQLAESETNNQNLQTYIVKLKESYMSTFGSGNESD